MAKRQNRLICVLLTFSLIVSGLAANGGSPVHAKKKIKLNKSKLTLNVGQKKKLKLNNYKKKVTWKSKKKKIATVSKKGWVKGKKAGKTTIICTYKYKGKKRTKKCSVTVKKKKNIPGVKPTSSVSNGNGKPSAPTPAISGTVNVSSTPSSSDSGKMTPVPSPDDPTPENPTPTPPVSVTGSPTPTPENPGTANPTSTAAATDQPGVQTPTPTPVETDVPEVTRVPGTPIPVPDPSKSLYLDFEDGKNEYVSGRQGEEELTVVEGGYQDNYCLKVSNRKKNWAGPQINVTQNTSDFTTYHIEAYVKHTAGSNRTINCMWQSKDSAGTESYTTIQTIVVPTGNWVKIDATVVAPGDISEVYMYFEMQNYANDFFVDNISVTEKHLDLDAVLAVDSLKDAYAGRFPMGCSVYSYNLKNPEILAFIKHHYSTITFGDELKPEILLDQEKSKTSEDGMPGINTDRIDKCLSLAQANDLKVRFHTLVWYSQTPDWYFCENYEPEYDGQGTEKANITNLVDKATMLARIESYITQIMDYVETKYPGTVYAYDVVNEAINDNGLKLRTGPQSLYGAIFTNDDNTYITEAFRYAKAAQQKNSSSAKLFYNDYVGLASSGQRKAVVNYLADAKAEGTIDGLGMQSHQTNLGVTDGDNIKNSINYFTQSGYEVQITELDFANKDNSEAGNTTLATAYSKFMSIILQRMDQDNASITNFTMWNITDLDTWLNTFYSDGKTYYPSLFDENYMPKPAFYALLDLVKGSSSTPTPTPGTKPTQTATPTVTPTVTPTADPGTVSTPTPDIKPTAEPGTKPTKPEQTVSLNLEEGNIIISSTGYTVGGGGETAYTGDYTITGTANNTIAITGGSHRIILDSVTTTATGASPMALSGDSVVTLWLQGTSNLTAPGNKAGIEVLAGTELKIAGDGTLFATGGASSAGIGASSTGSVATELGKISIYSGTILAYNNGRNAAGIGDGQVGKGGGEICIYGGNIYAQSSGNGAGIGGGGSAASNPEKMTIRIYGGLICAGGSTYEIGDGKNQTHCEVSVYGGAVHPVNSKTPFGTTVTTADEYVKKEVAVSSLSGIRSVTIDGVDQGISSFVITDKSGTTTPRQTLKLYMKASESHVVVVTDTDGVEHTTNF